MGAFGTLIELALFWWWEFELRDLQHWSFGIFAFLVGYAVTLFLMAALLFPDKGLDGFDGYEDFFLKRRHWFFGVFALTTLLDVIDTAIKGEPYLDTMALLYLVQVPIVLTLCAVAIRTSNLRYHLALVIIHLTYQAWWISVLFDTRA